MDFSELVSVTDEELRLSSKSGDWHCCVDAATEQNPLKEQHPDALVGFEQGGQFEFYADDAQKVSELLGTKLQTKYLHWTVPVICRPVGALSKQLDAARTSVKTMAPSPPNQVIFAEGYGLGH